MSTPPQDPALEKPGPADHKAVLTALEAITTSATFARADRPARFLRHLVETTLAGETHRLKETVLGVEVFGRTSSWDPRLDGIVRQEAARLRKRLARYYETEGAGAPLQIQLPVGGYVPVFVSTGEPEAPGLEAKPFEAPPGPQRTWVFWVAAAAIACAGIAGYWRWRSAASNPTATSIAVLAFSNLSPDPVNQYFAEGLTDEVTDLLAHNRALRVSARSSASQFNTKSSDLGSLGHKLNVANVLEGSVDRDGDRIRIIARLERVSDGALIWSNTYERQTSDLFAVQSELARAIAGNLNAAAGMPKVQQHVPSAAAHDAYMKGRYELQQLTPGSLDVAEADFQRAIDADPKYATAWAGLGLTRFNRALALTQRRSDGDRQRTEQAFRKALELDSEQTGIHSYLAAMKLEYDWDWTGAEQELKQALAGAPDADANLRYAYFLVYLGRFAEADPYIQRAEDLDPFGSQTLVRIGQLRYLEHRFPEGLDMMAKAASVAPAMVAPRFMSGIMLGASGRVDDAIKDLKKIEDRYPQGRMYEAVALAAGGRREEALQLMRPYEDKYPSADIPMQWFALCYGSLGDKTSAMKWLTRSADDHESQVLNMAVNPAFASIRTAPEFVALEKRIGLIK